MNNSQNKIIAILQDRPTGLTALQISEIGHFSGRTFVSRHLRALKEQGIVTSWQDGKNIYYTLNQRKIILQKSLATANLNEDQVWTQISNNPTLLNNTSENARNILYYAFTEMLNNAIDHSKSPTVNVTITIKDDLLHFSIRDFGIGVFRNIMQTKHFPDEIYAIQELMKGKITTAPKLHSGEGIYWTSKIADLFELRSYDYKLIVNNDINDYTIARSTQDMLTGTEVLFTIKANTNKSLSEFFSQYMSEEDDYTFNTTEIQIQLYQTGEIWISRSQAKRILSGLERYKKIILNFSNIELVGQAFCDEIFRVFHHNHPNITLEPINMNKSVELMVRHAQHDTSSL